MSKTIIINDKVEYEEHYYLIVPDNAAGRDNVYTVYKIPSSPSREISIIGRELPLEVAKQVVNKDGI